MLRGNEHFVIIKLVSGEQVMAVLEKETDENIEISSPLLLRLFPIIGAEQGSEHVTATPYCKFAEDSNITLNKRNILFVKNLHSVLIPHYIRLASEAEETVPIKQKQDGSVRKLEWEDEELEQEVAELSNEEIQKRIKMLEAIAKKEEEEVRNFVDGNDTIH
jgi:hypothetical protein